MTKHTGFTGFTGGSGGKEPTFKAGDMRRGFDPWVREDVLEKVVVPHSSILACRIPWTEEPGELQSTGVTKELDMTKRLNNTNCKMTLPI